TVARLDGERFVVRTDSGEYGAKRAVSCLVEPIAGDFVLVAAHASGSSWVLAVLERETGAATTVSVAGDMNLRLKQGKFTVAAQEGVALVSGKDVNVVSTSVQVNAVEGQIALRRLSFVGNFVRAEIEKVKLVAQSLDSVLERFSQKVKRSYRTVE